MVRGTVLVAFVTLATTYTIAVLHRDAPLVPMISDTFVYAPESYVSRFGVVTASAMLQLVVWLLRSYLCAFASGHRAWRWFATVHSLCGAVASAAVSDGTAIGKRHFVFGESEVSRERGTVGGTRRKFVRWLGGGERRRVRQWKHRKRSN